MRTVDRSGGWIGCSAQADLDAPVRCFFYFIDRRDQWFALAATGYFHRSLEARGLQHISHGLRAFERELVIVLKTADPGRCDR